MLAAVQQSSREDLDRVLVVRERLFAFSALHWRVKFLLKFWGNLLTNGAQLATDDVLYNTGLVNDR